ncbi:MAG TPA: GTP 3',8-cyclase MoaA [Candidatus Limnocylindrales bacterium]|nr:GTP 3',8-cyclase MoaA [Candidatus Limnocylindrales bacterium]
MELPIVEPAALRPEPPLPPEVAPTGAGKAVDGRAIHPVDLLGRPVRDLRISVTDRCNFRCVYCMPREIYGRDFAFLPRAELLTFEEIVRVASAFVDLGVEKLRLTGGEPLVRRDLPTLVGALSGLRTPAGGALDLTLTTNGAALRTLARPLAAAGLQRVTVSLDALDDVTFRAMNDVDFPVDRVLDGIEAAREAGHAPIKVNAVVRRGLNEQEILPLARWARSAGVTLRYIEYMDVGHSNGWRLDDVVPASEIVDRIDAELPLEPMDAAYRGEVARRYRFRDGSGEIGVIASVSAPFCGDCTRARLSADGTAYTCLFSSRGWDIRGRIRAGIDDVALRAFIARVWTGRDDRYSELRTAATGDTERDPGRVEMFAMGG